MRKNMNTKPKTNIYNILRYLILPAEVSVLPECYLVELKGLC